MRAELSSKVFDDAIMVVDLRLAAPTEFSIERGVVTMVGELNELKTDRSLADFDTVTHPQRLFDLSINNESCTGWKVGRGEGVNTVSTIDQWAVCQRMWTYRSNHECLQVLPQQRSTGTEIVRRRSDRCADDEPIAAVGGDRFVVDRKAQAQDP